MGVSLCVCVYMKCGCMRHDRIGCMQIDDDCAMALLAMFDDDPCYVASLCEWKLNGYFLLGKSSIGRRYLNDGPCTRWLSSPGKSRIGRRCLKDWTVYAMVVYREDHPLGGGAWMMDCVHDGYLLGKEETQRGSVPESCYTWRLCASLCFSCVVC